MIAIEVNNLTRDFETIRAVDGISFEVEKGIIFGFLGPNGAGKTTTIHMLLGLLDPSEGDAKVLGYDTRDQSDQVRNNTGALLEHSGVYEQLSAEDNLEYFGRIYRLPILKRQERIKELLTQIELWDRRKEKVGKWSKGMKQKLALARAMFHRPPLVFLDEPTAGLDVVSANAVRDNLAEIAARDGVTVFLTTHNMAEAEKLCSQVAVIRKGRLVAIGHPDELRSAASGPRLQIHGHGFNESVLEQLRAQPDVAAANVQNGRLTVDLSQDADVPSLVSVAVGAGAQVEEVRRDKASLEEVFMTLMEEEK
jgi:ABC-2 type transport system ATP-binding protein